MKPLSNPPVDSLSDSFTTCSAWCRSKWEEAKARGDMDTANRYMTLYTMWKERGQ